MTVTESAERFPDGTPIDPWFEAGKMPELDQMGKQYFLTAYGILDDGKVHTKELQDLADRIAREGGGCMVVPGGVYLTGAFFLKQGVNLYLMKGAVLKGSDDLSDYPIMKTRIEGQNCSYYPGLVNADGVDGLYICGEGTIDGNGLRSWKAFWQRRLWNPACTNKDEQRARLLYLSNCSNVTIAGITLQNSMFWTTHLYKCNHVRYLGCRIFSPAKPVKAPSTDAIDIDACTDICIRNCYMEVNDDSFVLKGGKGPWADQAPENGSNERILVEDCEFGYCHGILTCGSESIHNRNILMRRIHLNGGMNMLWLKMRPDTPQNYEYIRIEDVTGEIASFLTIRPWTQFYDLEDRKDIPLSYADHITIQRCHVDCSIFYQVEQKEEQYRLSNFAFRDLEIQTKHGEFHPEWIRDAVCDQVKINGVNY